MASMNKVDDLINKEIDDLLETGEKILAVALRSSSSLKGQELANVSSWVTRLGRLIRQLYGTDSQHFQAYSDALKINYFYNIHSNQNAQIAQMQGVIISIKHDAESGLLHNIRALLQADIFADFLEMAEYLLGEGYKDAAAVIIGAVLEDSLRKLCVKHRIATTNPSGKPFTIDPLNAALAKQGVYNRLVQK